LKRQIRLTVNGASHELLAAPHHTLLEVLRRELKLFSVREGCGLGLCGACTVLLDGKPISACLTLAALAAEREIVTVEGLAEAGRLDPIQQAFVDHTAFQCSYCTPGFILTTHALLAENPAPSADEIKEYLSGNLCRCGSYLKIVAAVQDAAGRMRPGPGS
jgi:carbon-monoxide dehydrogenase small subunit/isoquinoline 1-oxidoreductase alpha subunit/xanthine dehydrogenase YagT iron-sulfur-binding subunit